MKILLYITFLAIIISGCKSDDVITPPVYRKVTYKVTGTTSQVTVSYTRADNSNFFSDNCPLPFTVTVDNFKQGSLASFTVQNKYATGYVYAQIISDSTTIQQGTNNTPFGVITISKEVP